MRYQILITIAIVLYACEGTPVKTEAGSVLTDSARVSSPHYPIPSFIAEEINYAEDNPSGIIQYRTIDGQTDSGYVDLRRLKEVATRFAGYDLNAPAIAGHLKETSFRDETIGMVTLNYTSNNDEIPIRRADILVKEGPISNKVSSIYLEEFANRNDTLINTKLFWKSRKSCMIIEEKATKNGEGSISQTKLVWGTEDN